MDLESSECEELFGNDGTKSTLFIPHTVKTKPLVQSHKKLQTVKEAGLITSCDLSGLYQTLQYQALS